MNLALIVFVILLLPSTGSDAAERADDGRVRGRADAPITLIEYSDFTCGYCLKFFRETLPRLQAKYIDTGKLKFIYRDFPRADHGVGVDAAVAARCAGEQGRYWDMHDRLFSEGRRLNSDYFKDFAQSMGLDSAAFDKCYDERRELKSIFADRLEANRWGFHGTPGFILLQTASGATEKNPAIAIPGAFPFDDFAEEIDRMLSKVPGS